MVEPTRPGSWTGSDLLARLLRFGAAGAAIALVLAAREIWLQGYVALGWSYSAGRILRGAGFTGAALGAVGALALGAIRDNLVASLPALDAKLSVEALRGPPVRRAIVSLSAGLAAGAALVCWRILDEGGLVAGVWPWALTTALGAAAILGLAGRMAQRSAAALVWAGAFVFGWTLFHSDPYGRAELGSGDGSGPLAALLAAGLVFLCLRTAPPREVGLLRWLALAGLPLVVALALGLVSLGLNPSLVAGNPRSVVLVAVDTLRMDRTSLAPTDARTRTLTPALEALSKRAAVFTEATTQAPWTLPAFASVLTGRYPAEHGASSLQGRLRPGEQTLAEVMREAGYQTAGVVSHLFLDQRRGMAQGFAHFDESNILGDAEITGEGVTDAALAWLARRDEDPFFLLVHYFDPHYEYRDHADWDFADPSRSTLDLRDLHIYDLRARLGSLAPEDVRFLRDLYDEEVAFTDRTLGRLLEAVPEDAVLIVVGDHGEELLERGWLGHTVSLRREVVRVPLVVRLPGVTAPGAHIPGVVETRAVHGTVLDYLEIADATRAPRATLLPMLRGDGPPLETVFSQVWLPDEPVTTGKRVRRSLARQDRWLLIRDHDRAEDRLYSVDRLRGLELPVDAPAKQEELAAELDAWTRRMDAVRDETPTRALSEEERRQLEALGYL